MKKKLIAYTFTPTKILLLATLLSNFFNFLFNALMGRLLTFEYFAFITFVVSLWYLISIVLNALGATVTNKVAYLSTNGPVGSASAFYSYFRYKTLLLALLCGLVWLAASPLLSIFFKVGNAISILMYAPLITLGALAYVNRGFLQGQLFFTGVSILFLVESASRLGIALIFTFVGRYDLVYLSLPVSIILSFTVSVYLAGKAAGPNIPRHAFSFPKGFFLLMLTTNIATTAFITIDLLLVKHFFNPEIAGQYALLSLVGKMIYFLGSIINSLIFTYGSRNNAQSSDTVHKLFAATLTLTVGSFVLLGPLGHISTPLLFGAKTAFIVPFLIPYTLAISAFTLTNAIILYRLAQNKSQYAGVSIVMTFLLATGIIIRHSDLLQISYVILTLSIFGLVIVCTLPKLPKIVIS